MKYAWQIRRSTSMTISECLKKAWQLYRLTIKLRQGVVVFLYTKADGTIRKAVGTLKNISFNIAGKRVTKTAYKTLTYFDLDKKSFRCFKVENLLAIL